MRRWDAEAGNVSTMLSCVRVNRSYRKNEKTNHWLSNWQVKVVQIYFSIQQTMTNLPTLRPGFARPIPHSTKYTKECTGAIESFPKQIHRMTWVAQ